MALFHAQGRHAAPRYHSIDGRPLWQSLGWYRFLRSRRGCLLFSKRPRLEHHTGSDASERIGWGQGAVRFRGPKWIVLVWIRIGWIDTVERWEGPCPYSQGRPSKQ